MDWKYIVMLDINKIHDYIFGTNKLKEIRGASILLDRLNRKDAIDELTNNNHYINKWDCIVKGGGNIKVLFESESDATKYIKFLKKLFNDNAFGVDVTIILSEKDDSWTDEKWIDKAERKLQIEKLSKQQKKQIISSGYFKTCQACGLYPAEEKKTDRFICKGCFQKIDKSEEYKEMEIYNQLFNSIGFEPKLPKEFGKIGNKSYPKGYIGFIYADGNSIGEYIREEIKGFDEHKKFSENIEKATFDATIYAIKNNFEKDFTFQIILAGGDDLIMVVPAHKAIPITIDFCDHFNNNTEINNITTSAAVILCHDSVPIKNVLESAEKLLKNAKTNSRKDGNKCYIDFLAMTGSSLGDPISNRKKELEYLDYNKDILLTMRPYSIEGIQKLYNNIKKLKTKKFPKNKLNALHTSLFYGYHQAFIEASYIKTRLNDAHNDLIKEIETEFEIDENFPWKKSESGEYITPVEDIMELYEFINPEGEA